MYFFRNLKQQKVQQKHNKTNTRKSLATSTTKKSDGKTIGRKDDKKSKRDDSNKVICLVNNILSHRHTDVNQ
jgi:hypothetical protein